MSLIPGRINQESRWCIYEIRRLLLLLATRGGGDQCLDACDHFLRPSKGLELSLVFQLRLASPVLYTGSMIGVTWFQSSIYIWFCKWVSWWGSEAGPQLPGPAAPAAILSITPVEPIIRLFRNTAMIISALVQYDDATKCYAILLWVNTPWQHREIRFAEATREWMMQDDVVTRQKSM